MAERFSTTNAAGESAVFSPAGETILQLKAADPNARIDVVARVDASADWETVALLDRRFKIFARLPKFPFLKLVISQNKAGSSISVRDNS